MDILKPRAAKWFDKYEPIAKYNLAESYVEPMTLDELLELTGEREATLSKMLNTPLDYRFGEGSEDFRAAIAGLYANKSKDHVFVTSGAINANHIVLFGLIRPGDRVVCMHPNYQQLYAVPQAYGAQVELLELREENGYLPDWEELERVVGDDCRMIICTNPNNPTGAVMERKHLEKLVKIARNAGAYLLCDEIYKHFLRGGVDLPNVADLYEKGISTSSLSKVYALSGLRLGWVCASIEIIQELGAYRNYTVICCGILNDIAASLAFRHYDKLVARNTKIIEDNLAVLRVWLAGQPGLQCAIPAAGTFTLLKYNRDIPSEEFCQGLFERSGVFIMPGACFDMEGYIRIGFGIDQKIFQIGLEALSSYLQELQP